MILTTYRMASTRQGHDASCLQRPVERTSDIQIRGGHSSVVTAIGRCEPNPQVQSMLFLFPSLAHGTKWGQLQFGHYETETRKRMSIYTWFPHVCPLNLAIPTWRFPKMGVPPNHPLFPRTLKPSSLGYPPWLSKPRHLWDSPHRTWQSFHRIRTAPQHPRSHVQPFTGLFVLMDMCLPKSRDVDMIPTLKYPHRKKPQFSILHVYDWISKK